MRNEDGNEIINFVIGSTMILFLVIILIANGNTYKQIGQNKSSFIKKIPLIIIQWKFLTWLIKDHGWILARKKLDHLLEGFLGKRFAGVYGIN